MKCTLALCLCAFLSLAAGRVDRYARLLPAIKQVESSGGKDKRDGDGGDSIGSYQIQHDYWFDAIEHKPSIGGTYQDCRNDAYAEQIIRAYMDRYGGKNPTDEKLARIHNGGPRGHEKASTRPYWRKVQAAMNGGGK